MSLSSDAEAAYGPLFVPKAQLVSVKLGIPLDWLLAAISWETTGFKAKGPTWPTNKRDGGGGLIGFTPIKGHPAEFKGPVEQLDFVEAHYRGWMTKLKISNFKSPEDLYLIVRGPYGIGQPDSFNMGGGLNKGQVINIYKPFLARVGVLSSAPAAKPTSITPPLTADQRGIIATRETRVAVMQFKLREIDQQIAEAITPLDRDRLVEQRIEYLRQAQNELDGIVDLP
jgi:hypothetical protein